MSANPIKDYSPTVSTQTLGENVTWAKIKVSNISDGTTTKTTTSVLEAAAAVPAIQASLTTKVETTDARLSDARTPLTHIHSQADVTGLVTALNGKAALAHTHAQADVTGLATSLDTLTNNNSHTAGIANQNTAKILLLDSGKQNQVAMSTTDLTPGTSFLATGNIYVVYE